MFGDYQLDWISPDGRSWRVIGDRHAPVIVEAETVEGLVGQATDSPVTPVGVPGQRVDPRDQIIGPIEGSVTAVVLDVDSWPAFRASFSTTRQGTLRLITPRRVWRLPARLSAPLPSPGTRPRRGARIQVGLVADGGLWLTSAAATGPVPVTAWGDAPVWPAVRWREAGSVTLPSGARVDLPALGGGVWTLPLGRASGGLARGPGGEEWRLDVTVAEAVPVGETRTFVASDGVLVQWDVGVMDPWN